MNRPGKRIYIVFQSLIALIIIVMLIHLHQGLQKQQQLQKSVDRLEHNENVLLHRVERLENYRRDLNRHKIFLEVLNQTMEIRGLPTHKVIPIKTVDEDFLVNFLQIQWEKHMGERIVHIETVLKKMGLIEPDYNIESELTKLYLEQTAGFYDYHENLFYIMDTFSMNSIMGKIIVAHELTHFLQDQHFDIENLLAEYDKNTDQQTAILSILEGDATLAMLEWSMKHGVPGSLQELTDFFVIGDTQVEFGQSPQIIKDMLLQPYLAGIDFFLYLQNAGIEDWRNKPFQKPPVSMEMVLHPEKYLKYNDFPRDLYVPAKYEAHHGEILYTDAFGELYLRSVIRQFNQHKEYHPHKLAQGWNGDTFFLFEDGFILWMLCFDTAQDEEAFQEFLEVSENFWNSALSNINRQLVWEKQEGIFFLQFRTVQK